MTKFIYITARGHSGSTILDAILGNAFYIESVGELVSGVGRYFTEICSCGESMKTCCFWQTAIEEYSSSGADMPILELFEASKIQAHIRNFIPTLFGIKRYKQLTANSEIFINAIASLNQSRFVVDSSKEPTRALLLSRSSDTHIIHLIRNPERVIASTYFRIKNGYDVKILRRKFNIKNPFFMFAYLVMLSWSWLFGNIMMELVKFVSKNKVITVKYENLINNPKTVMDDIEKHLNTDLSDVIQLLQKGEQMSIGHNIGGNHFRHNKVFKLDSKKSTHRSMPFVYSLMTYLINFPLVLYYGYFIKRKHA